MHNKYKYIYGPVSSWRLGVSLGVDLLSQKEKICTFDCVYCQLGKTRKFTVTRKTYVPSKILLEEINSFFEKSGKNRKVDYITFSGRGDPSLAENLGQVIRDIKATRGEKIAVITNSALFSSKEVRRDLLEADFVMAKLDACSGNSLEEINKPAGKITFDSILKGIKRFRSDFKGKLALQIMFVEANRENAGEFSALAGEINPDEVQLNTPLRPCGTKPLSRKEMEELKKYFKGMKVVSVYESSRKKAVPLSRQATLKRRGRLM